jgi:hypothetical protein
LAQIFHEKTTKPSNGFVIAAWYLKKKQLFQKIQNFIRGLLFDYLTLRASRVHSSAALSEP